MDQPAQSKHTGKKIWFGIVITLSVLVLVFSVIGVIGTWVLRGTLSDFTVSLLQTAENTAGRAQEVIAQVETPLGEIQQIATNVAKVSSELSQNVQDEGLLKLLLPPEQEQKLVDLATKVQDTLATVHEVLAGAANLYETINRMPFITLPELGLEKVRAVEQTVNEIRLAIEELKGNVAQIRAGAAEKIGVVTEIATRISDRLAEVQDNLAVLDAELEGFQQTLAEVRSAVPTVFALAALLITLLLVYIAYTQVEVIRLFVLRWRLLEVTLAVQTEDASGTAEIVSQEEGVTSMPSEEEPPSEVPGEDEAQE
jgi:archaellum component FlaC